MNRDLLADAGVLYPQWSTSTHHNSLAWEIQKGRIDSVRAFLSGLVESDNKCGACLLSGEDFENCIYDTHLAKKIVSIALTEGFKSVTWHVVVRAVDEYARSLWNELSAHDIVVKFNVLEKSVEERGAFFASTFNYNYIFVVDYNRFSERFKAGVNSVVEYDFSAFCERMVGWSLLSRIIPHDRHDKFIRNAIAVNPIGQSPSRLRVHAKYVLTRLNLTSIYNRDFRKHRP